MAAALDEAASAEALEAELEVLREFRGISSFAALQEHGVALDPGERLYLTISGGALVEVKRAQGHYQAGNAGVRVRVAKGDAGCCSRGRSSPASGA